MMAPEPNLFSRGQPDGQGANQSPAPKILNFLDLDVINMYYLLTSNRLNISSESMVIYLLYIYCGNKSSQDISLMLRGLRFEHVPLEHLFNLARDIRLFQESDYFISHVHSQVHQRIETKPYSAPYQPAGTSRR